MNVDERGKDSKLLFPYEGVKNLLSKWCLDARKNNLFFFSTFQENNEFVKCFIKVTTVLTVYTISAILVLCNSWSLLYNCEGVNVRGAKLVL